MFPFADDTRSYSLPIWVFILIGLNALFFIGSYSSGEQHYMRTLFAYGTIPARFFQADAGHITFEQDVQEWIGEAGIDQDDWAPPFFTLISSIFLHGGIMHIVGNMWFLWLFGDNVEDRMGKLIFPVFYILCGVIAGLIHVAVNASSTVPAIGASGAIAGIMGAYIYLHPEGQISTLMTFGWYWRTVQIPAFLYLIIWFGLQLIGGFAGAGASNVAFWAHIGGFIAGLLLAMLLKSMNLLTLYPGDRGHSGFREGPRPIRESFRSRIETPRRKKYVWKD